MGVDCRIYTGSENTVFTKKMLGNFDKKLKQYLLQKGLAADCLKRSDRLTFTFYCKLTALFKQIVNALKDFTQAYIVNTYIYWEQ